MSIPNRILAEMLRDELKMDGTPTSSLSDIFEREPAPLTEFITSPRYLKNPRLSEIQYDFVHTMEQIYLPETYIAMVEEFGEEWMVGPTKHMLVAQWGKGAGKDSCCRLGVTRVADLLNCLRNPLEYYGLPDQDDIHILNVASSQPQARRAFFAPMRRLFSTNKHMMGMLRDGVIPPELATSIRLEKNVELLSGHSEADTQEGLNLLVGIADEISAFKTEDELARAGIVAEGRAKKTAEGIVKMLRTSARTRFPKCFKVAQISYPRFRGDAIQQATANGMRSITKAATDGTRSQYYVSGPYATWDVNPRVSNKEDFQEDYDEDPEMAQAMYECKPSGAVNRFMRNDFAIAHAFSIRRPTPVSVEYYWGLSEKTPLEDPDAPPEVESWQVRFHFHPDFQARPGALYCLHGDLAKTSDRAGVAMSHVREWGDHVEEAQDSRPIVRNDFTFSFAADLKALNPDGVLAPREIQMRWYRQLIWELYRRGFTIMSVTFDGWQSTDMMQILQTRGIESKLFSLDRSTEGYRTLRDLIEDQRLEAYTDDDIPETDQKLVVRELQSLQLLPNGKIDHPHPGSKDESDALAGSVVGAVLMGGSEGDLSDTMYGTDDQLSMYLRSVPLYSSASLNFGEGSSLGLNNHGDLAELGFGG